MIPSVKEPDLSAAEGVYDCAVCGILFGQLFVLVGGIDFFPASLMPSLVPAAPAAREMGGCGGPHVREGC